MSHELRTPLNSLLILSDQLCKNPDGNLTGKQVEFSKTIHSSGNDLLMLINDILDLSKIESGTVAVDVSEVRIDDLHRSIERSFRHFAESKHLDFRIDIEQPLPKSLVTDVKRLQQIIKNLLSNAFKFTHQGSVSFSIASAARRLVGRQRGAAPRQPGDRVLGLRHRHRHLARQAADHLRGVPAGRRLDLAQVRRHRPRPGDQPRALAPARRRDQARQQAGHRQHLHALPAAELQPGEERAPAAARPRRGRRRPAPCGEHRRRRPGPARRLHRHGRARRRGEQRRATRARSSPTSPTTTATRSAAATASCWSSRTTSPSPRCCSMRRASPASRGSSATPARAR